MWKLFEKSVFHQWWKKISTFFILIFLKRQPYKIILLNSIHVLHKKIHRNEDFNCNLFEYSSSLLSTGCSSWKLSKICHEIDSVKIAKSMWLAQGLGASKLRNPWKNYYCLNFSSSTCIWQVLFLWHVFAKLITFVVRIKLSLFFLVRKNFLFEMCRKHYFSK